MLITRLSCVIAMPMAILFGSSQFALAQQDALTINPATPFSTNVYLEAYYVGAQHSQGALPDYIYSYQQTSQANINLALIQSKYASEHLRANLGLASGTFMRANYAKEAGVLNNLYQANIGVRLSDHQQWWLDVGVLPSHIGLETAKGNENWTLTRSMMADNSPYFETGAKLSFSSQDQRWTVAGLVLNGWQRIRRQADNSTPAIGHLISYQAPSGMVINSSSFIGSDTPDNMRKMRYFHHLDMQFALSDHWQVQAAWDIGAEQAEKSSSRYYVWHAPLIQTRYQWDAQWALSARWEGYHDPHQVIVRLPETRSFSSQAVSLNLDYRIAQQALYRIELKRLQSAQAIYGDTESAQHSNYLLSTALLLEF